jgi:hypothetical protein
MVAVMPRQRESTQRIIATITDAGTPMTLQVSDGTVGAQNRDSRIGQGWEIGRGRNVRPACDYADQRRTGR